MRLVLFAAALAGCASGTAGNNSDANGNGGPDAKIYADGHIEGDIDAHVYHDAHVYEDAHIYNDAHVYNDAHIYEDAHVFMDACVPVQTQLLVNAGFDLGPNNGWHEVQVGGELLSTYLPQAGTYSAWMGGYVADFGDTDVDELFQDIAVPAGTTALTLTGYYVVGTTENPNDFPYDTGTVELAHTDGTTIETALSLSNQNNGTAYTTFSHSFAVGGVAGTTVRLLLTTSNDFSNYTNFFFDTLALTATHCN